MEKTTEGLNLKLALETERQRKEAQANQELRKWAIALALVHAHPHVSMERLADALIEYVKHEPRPSPTEDLFTRLGASSVDNLGADALRNEGHGPQS
jgi:hypothetical protein